MSACMGSGRCLLPGRLSGGVPGWLALRHAHARAGLNAVDRVEQVKVVLCSFP